MAEIKKLRLKSARSRGATPLPSESLPIAVVSVDTGVFHLDQNYDYLVPAQLHEAAKIGTSVLVPFGSQSLSGIILDRRAETTTTSLKFLEKVTSLLPLISPEELPFFQAVAQRYAVGLNEVIKAVIPERSTRVEQLFQGKFATIEGAFASEKIRALHLIPPNQTPHGAIREFLSNQSHSGQVLIIVPDEKDVKLIHEALIEFDEEGIVVLTSSLPRSERYRNYLRTLTSTPRIIIGTRSATLAPIAMGSTLILYGDGESSLYSQQYPYWSARELLLLRAERANLHFFSYAPSLELARLVELGWLKVEREEVNITGLSFDEGKDSYISIISQSLKKGSVLVTTAVSGYINSFSCQKCRNRALCECGGRLYVDPGLGVQCSLCQRRVEDWSCLFCGEKRIRTISKGGERLAAELGKSFPGISVITSTSQRRIDQLPEGRHLVVSTNGCEPVGNYSGVVLLDGEYLFNRTGLHSDEEARRAWFLALSMKEANGLGYVSLSISHPVSQSLQKWNVYPQIGVELEEHKAAMLPPYYRIAAITGEAKEIEALRSTFSELELFSAVSLLAIDSLSSKLIVRTPVERSREFSDFFYDFRRVRSLTKARKLSITLDPYEL